MATRRFRPITRSNSRESLSHRRVAPDVVTSREKRAACRGQTHNRSGSRTRLMMSRDAQIYFPGTIPGPPVVSSATRVLIFWKTSRRDQSIRQFVRALLLRLRQGAPQDARPGRVIEAGPLGKVPRRAREIEFVRNWWIRRSEIDEVISVGQKSTNNSPRWTCRGKH